MEIVKGIEGEFTSPINGDNHIYSLRIYKSLVDNNLLKDLELHDENESYKLYVGSKNVIVVKEK